MRFLILILLFIPEISMSDSLNIPVLNLDGSSDGNQKISISLQILLLMSVLTLLPTLLITMTSFTRIIIILSILRQALGLATTPTNQVLVGLSLFLTLFTMYPTLNQISDNALQPLLDNKIDVQTALARGTEPLKSFMLRSTRENDLNLFFELSQENFELNDIPITVLMPAFLTSELKTAFQMGFVVFLPFLIIDLLVASVLMSMGMMMLSPLIISLPFKILLFVLVDGWVLVLGTISQSIIGT